MTPPSFPNCLNDSSRSSGASGITPPWVARLWPVCLALLLLLLLGSPNAAFSANTSAQMPTATPDVQLAVAWIRGQGAHGDNRHQPFAVIDKKAAALHVFDANGVWRASTPVLLGLAVGDESVPGIGERPMAAIAPHERTTPAGRFASEPGVNLQGEDIVWIDYAAAVSMHRVRTANKADRRLARLATPTVADNRISYGCVNLPAAFYDQFIKPDFGRAPAVVYVLPETRAVAGWLQSLQRAP